MPDLNFRIEGAETAQFAASPQILLKVRVTNADPAEAIQAVVLRCQVQLEVTRRRYTSGEQQTLKDLFGEPERWSQTLRNLLWTHVNVNIPPFRGEIVVDVALPCTFDFNVGATKYFHGLDDGIVPLCLMFSGTVFYAQGRESLLAAPISWEKEARYNLPVKVWKDMMDAFYPNSSWLRLRRDVFERLYEYKVRHGIPTWEQALESILETEEALRR